MADDPIQAALAKIAELDAGSARLKRFVNEADILMGREPRFGNVGDTAMFTVEGAKTRKQFSPGQFFNKPFAGAVKMILVSRFEAEGNEPSPASVDEIHEALAQGSFNFETAGVDAQKNSIRISLGKNSITFVKLPGTDLFGLVEWYGKKMVKGRKVMQPALKATTDTDNDEDAELEEAVQAELEKDETETPPTMKASGVFS